MRMAQKEPPKTKPEDLGGWRFIRRLEPELKQLAAASQRHGNQVVLMSHVLVAHLLATQGGPTRIPSTLSSPPRHLPRRLPGGPEEGAI